MIATWQPAIEEIYLMPGDLHFGPAPGRISTLLGSCVSIALWHPKRRMGGMCHYLLPSGRRRPGSKPGAYADEAIAELVRHITRAGSRPAEYRASLVGGGHMFPMIRRSSISEIGDRNVAAGRSLLATNGFTLYMEDTGGSGHRHVEFDLATGDVRVRFERQPPSDESLRRPA
ncbi:MAG: chemotaxis protein CheD [Betaproteobacteria bacterium]|nr:chemotaxis protein CheD [Betaproteobacteria bacterium]